MMAGLEHARELRLAMKQMDAGVFTPILQGGFQVMCKTEVTIEDLLREDFGITMAYMERRLNTVFLDGQCIDDIDTATVHGGCVLALSSAMPGLVGATLRRKGILAPMRASITHREGTISGTSPVREGLITIKLFNILAGELGPVFLARGIYVKGSELADFLRMRTGQFWSSIDRISLDGRPADRDGLLMAIGCGRAPVKLAVVPAVR